MTFRFDAPFALNSRGPARLFGKCSTGFVGLGAILDNPFGRDGALRAFVPAAENAACRADD